MPGIDMYGRPYADDTSALVAQQAQAIQQLQTALASMQSRIDMQNKSAVVEMPRVQDLGGQGEVPWVRSPFWPGAPFYSTRPDIGYTTRLYSQGINSTDADYVVGTEMTRQVPFDLPCVVLGLTGGVFSNAQGNALPVGVNPLDLFLVRFEYVQGDQFTVSARLGGSVLGTAKEPADVGGTGWTMNTGSTLTIGFTPLVASLRVDVTLWCLEMRGPSNFVRG